jgi:exosortase/archaeosortase family protein
MVREFYKNNKSIIFFIAKLIGFVILWKNLHAYVLKPTRVPDDFLTRSLTSVVTWCLNTFYHMQPAATWISKPARFACFVQQNGKDILMVHDSCNGLPLMVLYLSLIILLPYSFRRKVGYGIGGVLAIFLADVIRCVALYRIYLTNRGMFEVNHHYVFTFIIYIFIFITWFFFTKRGNLPHHLAVKHG